MFQPASDVSINLNVRRFPFAYIDFPSSSSMNILERRPNAVGVTSSTSSSSPSAAANTVTVSGAVVPSVQLQAGKYYYGSTKGNLVASTSYAGREDGSCAWLSSSSGAQICEVAGYIYDSSSNAYIAEQGGRVGVALSSTSLGVDVFDS